MRHNILRNKLSRNTETRRALIKNTIRSFFMHNNLIKSTLIRAKVIRIEIEKIITIAKRANAGVSDKLSVIRQLHAYLGNMILVNNVFKIAENLANRNGGYTRVIKAGFRKGDNACVAYIQLVS
ncbi:MAG: 50S ribosomal protein L17 [Rickettsiales bacterium]